MKILIAGGTGLVGNHLTEFLIGEGHEVRLLTRTVRKSDGMAKQYLWQPDKGQIDPAALDDIEILINLTGSNVGDARWSAQKKKMILNSRVDSGQLLFDAVSKCVDKPKLYISASGTGAYGIKRFEEVSTEGDPFGTDFLANVCEQWEAKADAFSELGIRVIKMRLGVVFSPMGGALTKIIQPIRYFVGAPLGTGKQIMPWIHYKDLNRLIGSWLSDPSIEGVYNVVAPSVETNEQITRLIARKISRPLFLPKVPGWALKLLLGQMAEIILAGNIISPQKVLNSGFKFDYDSLKPALDDLMTDLGSIKE